LDDPPPDIIVMPADDFLALPLHSPAGRGQEYPCIAYGRVAQMESAFSRGCADFIREPWSLPELLARAKRLAKPKFQAGESILEFNGTCLAGGAASVELGPDELVLLRLLIQNAPLPVPRDTAMRALSPSNRDLGRALGRGVSSLRVKLNAAEPGLGRRLVAIRGFGYRLDVHSCA
jgi:two-component system, OmpR family, response regulator